MDTEVVGLGRYWQALRRRRWVVVASMLVFAAGVAAYVGARPASYSATAEVLIKPYSAGKFAEADFTTAQVDTQVAVMSSLIVVQGVVQTLNLPETAIDLQKSVSAASVGDTSIIGVTVTRSSATQAAVLANAMARSYKEFRQTHLPAGAHNSNYATIVSTAQPAKHRSGPSVLQGVLFGLVIGLVVGCAAALVIDRRDKSLGDERAIVEATGDLPVLGRIPVNGRRPRGPVLVERRDSPEAVAYRFLATTVRLLARDLKSRSTTSAPTVVLVVSAAPRDARTTVTANMAFAAAEAGQRMLVCDADLTRPGLTKLFGLSSDTTLEALLQRSLPIGLDLLDQPAPNVYALGTGPVLTSQSALLGDGRFRALVDRLPPALDVVIVDTSPLLSSADVLDLVPQADLVLVVVRERFSKGSDVKSAIERIGQAGGRVAGVVVTGSHSPLGTQRSNRRRAT